MSLFFFLNNSIIAGKEEILFITRAGFTLQVLREIFCFHVSSRWGSVLGKLGYKDTAFFQWPLEIAFLKVGILCFWYSLMLEHCFLYHKVPVRIL